MILAGDIGGTKTVLALFPTAQEGTATAAIHETRYPSGSYDSLEAIVTEFLAKTKARPAAASFGVAGPVRGGRARITNLPWVIDTESLRSLLGIRNVYLLNDLHAIAVAIPHLRHSDLITLNPGRPEPRGNMAVIAPGTGLGVGYLLWTGNRYQAYGSEAGHTSFAPRAPQEMELLKYLQGRFGHVSFERVCSGSQLPSLYEFLLHQGQHAEPEWLAEALAKAQDRTPVIVQAALEKKSRLCEATLDLFVQALATVIGNMALTLLATGGIYLGGGIPPRILARLQQPDFPKAIADKGRFGDLCAAIPLHVIRDPKAALLGAAWLGIETLAEVDDRPLPSPPNRR
jgi:glucokinase